MKLIVSRHYTPDTHWTKWIEEGFDFCEYSQPWEHPGVSPLAYETKATYGDLDHDSDSFLRSLVSQVWAKDFAQREGEIDEKLVQDSQQFMELRELHLDIFYHEKFHAEDVPREWFEQSEFAEKNLEDPYRWSDGGFGSMGRNVTNGHMVVIRYYNEVIEPEIEALWEAIIVRMLVTKTNPTKESVVQHATERLWAERHESYKDSPALFIEEYKEKFFLQRDKKFEEWALSSSYEAVLTLYPVENLFSYFHDEIVFNNYIQTFVMYGREHNAEGNLMAVVDEETDFVTSRRLLEDSESVTEDEIRYLVGRSHAWWT